MKDYVILCIDEAKVTSEIKYEKLDANDFESPNIYGPLNVDAVIDTIPYTFDSEDKFIMNSNLRGISLINQVMADMNLEYLSHRFFNDRNI